MLVLDCDASASMPGVCLLCSPGWLMYLNLAAAGVAAHWSSTQLL